ncbi:MAG: DNA mismatch repair protein MutS [Schleiferiaceae bacterium]|nr:DNA mismatch repair protein MutS [Schleiferiaceae bacterium]
MAGKSSETPLMKQYYSIKAKHPSALLLFRVGDFYETFGEDAIKTARILGIVLTKRANGAASSVELAGFPHHALENYLPKLVRAGQRVAICDQLEDPKLTKTIVKRGVTELVTPGVTFSDHILNSKNNNFLAAVAFDKDSNGVAFVDISTGEFFCAEGSMEYVDKLLQSFQPSEVLYSKKQKSQFSAEYKDRWYSFACDDWVFQYTYCFEQLTGHFQSTTLKGYGMDGFEPGVIAAGAILHYLKDTQHNKLQHITGISRIHDQDFVWMDRFTIRNLELFHTTVPGGTSLCDVLDNTQSPMGARLLKRWLAMPLKDKNLIETRLSIVSFFVKQPDQQQQIAETIGGIYDLERLVSKIAAARIQPRELKQLQNGLQAVKKIKDQLANTDHSALQLLGSDLDPCDELHNKIEQAIENEPAALISKGGVIKKGFDEALDELRNLVQNGKDILLGIQQREAERTGIPSLKLAFNNVFGYYLEVRNTHKDKVPDDWIRKQTLVNAERYITEELKVYEQKILTAEDEILGIETKLYEALVVAAQEHIKTLQRNAQLIARLDCLSGFAANALQHNYCKPILTTGSKLEITGGRHPVIELQLNPDNPYVANDVVMNREDQQILMITGPNMSGKSALLRQTALIPLMAQMGSFVPAEAVEMDILDKIFVRVGASDNISQGESTFMVEMNETASILNNLSENSLVLLDEIGRGTSTYDGVSIAWAIAEYIHEHPARAKTLFATHYHELNEMATSFERVKNFNVSIKEMDQDVIFLRKLKAGGSEHSFGIHVAKMAGMPKFVIQKANTILAQLEESRKTTDEKAAKTKKADAQLSFFQLDDPILEAIRADIKAIDINTLTPVEALMFLNDIKKKIGV